MNNHYSHQSVTDLVFLPYHRSNQSLLSFVYHPWKNEFNLKNHMKYLFNIYNRPVSVYQKQTTSYRSIHLYKNENNIEREKSMWCDWLKTERKYLHFVHFLSIT